MARPKGTKYIETPEKMYELFTKYKNKVKSKPRLIYQLSQKLGEAIPVPVEVPLTFEGFSVFCQNEIGCVKQYFHNQDNLYTDYIAICSRIKEEIRQDQIEGGMVGQYNPSITQRLNSLTERQDVTTNGKEINDTVKVEIVKPDESD